MKKTFYSFLSSVLLLTISFSLQSQNPFVITDIFCEDFDSVQTKWKMTSTSFPSNRPAPFFRDTIVTKDMSDGSASDTVGKATMSFLTTPNLFVDTFTSVTISFDQICYIEALDDATVEYSFDGGSTWSRVPSTNYNGPSNYFINGEPKFSKTSRPVLWRFTDTTYVWPSTTNAWVREDFNITSLIDAAKNTPTYNGFIMVRLGLYDDPSSVQGRVGTHRWYVDNFCVKGGNCDLVPPVVDLVDPPQNYPSRFENRVYLKGPYIFDAKVTDNQGKVDSVYIIFKVKRDISPNGTGQWAEIDHDTIGMTRLAGGNFRGSIPSVLPNGGTIQVKDTVCWKVEAVDGSPCQNKTQDPPSGFTQFQVRPDLPVACQTQPIFSYPYYQTFNGNDFVVTDKNGPPQIVTLAEDWNNVTGDFHEWWVAQGPSSDTGQFRVMDSYPPGNKYMLLESKKPAGGTYKDSTAYLLSPCIDLTDLPNGLVRFYVNMNTAGIEDSIRIDIFDPTPLPNFPDGRYIPNAIPSIKGDKGDQWLPVEFSTFPYSSFITQVRFVATPGRNDGLGDMGLDSFKIIPAPLTDLRINSVVTTPYVPVGKPGGDKVTVNIQNLGVADVNSFTVQYQILDGSTAIYTSSVLPQTITIQPGQNINIELQESYQPIEGRMTIRAWIQYTGDARPTNDTTQSTTRGLIYNSLKYIENFDKKNTWVNFSEDDTLTNQWEFGTPNYDHTYSAYSEPNSWDVLLNRPYTGTGTTTRLLSSFYNMSSVDSVILSFINNRDIDTTKDGVFLEYSLDRGLSWDSVTSGHDAGRLKWYNSFLSSGGLQGTPVFADKTFCYGNTWSGWLESELLLPSVFDFEDEVLFRFSFFAELDNDGNDGMSIDDVLIYKPDPLDMQAQHFVSPTSRCDLTANQRIRTVFKNRGLKTVNTFNIEYRVTHVPTNQVEVKTDVINRTVAHRDSIHIKSQSTFNMVNYGDYIVEVIAKLPGDGCIRNDTLTKLVENVEGCSLQFYIETSFRPNVQASCDSSVWSFNYTSGGRNYRISEAYNSPEYGINTAIVNDTIKDLFICMKSDATVRFELDDIDTLINNYSFIAFDGENDTILYSQVAGGPDSPTQFFKWNCPPERSATPIDIKLDNDLVQLPVAKKYAIDVVLLNNGLDSLDSVQVFFQVDQMNPLSRTVSFLPDLDYNRNSKVAIDSVFLSPGNHKLTTWTTLPNGQVDLLMSDDTLVEFVTIMDTIRVMDPLDSNMQTATGNYKPEYCDDFDDVGGLKWVSVNPYTMSQERRSFEFGSPSSTIITGANSGSNAWATNLDSNYRNVDSASLISPFFYIQKDSCYGINFMHNFYITDSLHDGGTIQMLKPGYSNYDENDWAIFGNHLGDTLDSNQIGWFNTLHILSIPNNNQNKGWTGNSNGWKRAANTLIPSDVDYFTALRWRFESDGSKNSDGWAIDDFCIENLHISNCFTVGLRDNLYEKSDLYLGQNIPNPAAYNTTIPYHVPKAGNVEFIVVNMLGQTIHSETLNRPSGDGLLELDLSNYSKGIYYYSMIFDGVRVTNKMIITK